MKITTILEMLEANREYLMQSSRMALDNLSALHRDFDSIDEEACIISLALNDSIASMRFFADYEKAISNSQAILDRFPKSPYASLMSRHYRIMGRCYALSGKYKEAEKNLDQAMSLASTLPSDLYKSMLHVDILNDLAMTNSKAMGDFEKSINYLQKALEYTNEPALKGRKGICLMGLGIVKSDAGKYDEAYDNHQQAALIFEYMYDYLNLASAYNNMAICCKSMDRMEETEKLLQQALDLRIRVGNKDEVANSYNNLGLFYELIDKPDAALSAFLASREYAKDMANTGLYIKVLESLEKMSDKSNDHINAAIYRQERLRITG